MSMRKIVDGMYPIPKLPDLVDKNTNNQVVIGLSTLNHW